MSFAIIKSRVSARPLPQMSCYKFMDVYVQTISYSADFQNAPGNYDLSKRFIR